MHFVLQSGKVPRYSCIFLRLRLQRMSMFIPAHSPKEHCLARWSGAKSMMWTTLSRSESETNDPRAAWWLVLIWVDYTNDTLISGSWRLVSCSKIPIQQEALDENRFHFRSLCVQDVIGKLQSFRDQLKSVVDEVRYWSDFLKYICILQELSGGGVWASRFSQKSAVTHDDSINIGSVVKRQP